MAPLKGLREQTMSPKLILRAVLALVPLAWVAGKVDLRTVLSGVATVGLPTFLLTCLLPLASASVGPVRWGLLLRTYGSERVPPLSTLWRHNLVGIYFNALPGAIAGDALRSVRTKGALSGTVDSATVVLTERVAGLTGLLLLGAGALLFGAGIAGLPVAAALGLGGSLAVGLGLLLFFSPQLYRRVVRKPPRAPTLARVDSLVRNLRTPRSPGGILAAVLISLVTQGLPAGQVIILTTVLSPAVDPASVMLVLPVIILLTYIPITPAAVGQREVVYVAVLGKVGVAPDAAVAASLLVLAGALVLTLVGGGVHLLELALGWQTADDGVVSATKAAP